MAFSVTARQSGASASTVAETITSSSDTPTASSLFLVCAGVESGNHATAHSWQTPTGGGLSYTQIAQSTQADWDTSANFDTSAIMWRADVGGSPSAFTVAIDAFSGTGGTNDGLYSVACLDITGHTSSTPVQSKANGGTITPASSSASGTVVLDSPATSGNLLVVAFAVGADTGGACASPTAGGGKTFTTVFNQSAAKFTIGVFYRVADGGESQTITCSDLGDTVGNYGAIAVEIAGTAPPTMEPRPYINTTPLRLR